MQRLDTHGFRLATRATRLVLLLCALLIVACATSPSAPAPTATQVTVADAERAYAAADWPKAARAYQQLVDRSPQDAGLWFRLGNALARTEQPDRAVSAYRQALARDGGLHKAWFNLALVQLREAQLGFAHLAEKLPADDPMRLQAAEAGVAITTLLSNYDGRTPPAAPVSAPVPRAAEAPRIEAPAPREPTPAAAASDQAELMRDKPSTVAPTQAGAPAKDTSSTASESAPAPTPKATSITKKKPARKRRKRSPPATAAGAPAQQAAPAAGAGDSGASEAGAGTASGGGTANDPRE